MEIPAHLKIVLKREAALLVAWLFFGLVLLPVVIYLVGGRVFGDYGGHGYGDFFRALSGKVRGAELDALFLVLSPYLAYQAVRLTTAVYRFCARLSGNNRTNPA